MATYEDIKCLRFRPLAGIMVLIADWLIEDERYEN